jgi:hypothetical protein
MMDKSGKRKDYGVSIRIPLTDEAHTALRIAAARDHVSRGFAVAWIVENWLRDNGHLRKTGTPLAN